MERRRKANAAGGLRAALAVVWLAFGPGAAIKGADAPDPSAPKIRIALSTSVSGLLNQNDVRAAIKVWQEGLSQQMKMRVEYLGGVPLPPEPILEAMRNGTVDAATVSGSEILRMMPYLDTSVALVDSYYVHGGEEYIVLVNEDSGIHSLQELRGHTLLIHDGVVMTLARDWLEVRLVTTHEGPAKRFFANIETQPRLSKVVLPVFFRQADACLVAQRAFATMCELNPQLGKKLKVLAVSEKLVPVVIAFRKTCPPEAKARFIAAIQGLSSTVYGRQILTFFQSNSVTPMDGAVLGPTLKMLAEAEQINARARN
jgi:phosphonate transport system substrate-binding protein